MANNKAAGASAPAAFPGLDAPAVRAAELRSALVTSARNGALVFELGQGRKALAEMVWIGADGAIHTRPAAGRVRLAAHLNELDRRVQLVSSARARARAEDRKAAAFRAAAEKRVGGRLVATVRVVPARPATAAPASRPVPARQANAWRPGLLEAGVNEAALPRPSREELRGLNAPHRTEGGGGKSEGSKKPSGKKGGKGK